jgi:hypothetical protein
MATLTALAMLVTVASVDGAGVAPAAAVAMPAVEDAPDDAPEPEVVTEPVWNVWDTLAQCESTGNWHAATGNGYFGGLQEDMVFWGNHGGLAYAARPDLASPEAQIQVAINGRDGLIGKAQGWAAWPACSRRLGLR